MMRTAVTVLLALLLASCESGSELSANEKALVDEIGFDEDTALALKSVGDSFERFQGVDDQYQPFDVDGLLVSTSSADAFETLVEVRRLVAGKGYSAYVYDLGFGFSADQIAIVPFSDDYEYLATVRVDGINYDISHDDVINRYREWDESYDLALLGANFEWLEAEIRVEPASWSRFAEQVYEFCPDVVDQGAGTVEALAEEMERSRHLYLWWD